MKKNAVGHFEMYADARDAPARFYASLFDWALEPVPGMDYTLVKTVETGAQGPTQVGGINGGMMKRPAGFGANVWVNYVMVDSVDETLSRAQALGATVTRGKSPVPRMGWFAMLVDPQGNSFAIFQQDPKAA